MENQRDRRYDLLSRLRSNRSGMTIDELSESLSITRTAVRQHLSTLERDGLVDAGGLRPTQGRPVRTYQLTPLGWEAFPKQYAWFSALVLEAIREERGSEGLARWLKDIAAPIGAGLRHRVAGKPLAAQVQATVDIMNELNFDAEVCPDPEGAETPGIKAVNCVYHALASQLPEVCQFDIELIERLTAMPVRHEECLVRGGSACRFSLGAATAKC